MNILKILLNKINKSAFKEYFSHSAWMLMEYPFRFISSIVINLLLARELGPSNFGIFSFVVGTTAIITSIGKLGLDSIILRDFVNADQFSTEKLLGTAFWLRVISSIFLTILFLICYIQIEYKNPELKFIILLLFGFIFQSVEVIEFYFQSKIMGKKIFVLKTSYLLISTLIKIIFLLNHSNLETFIYILVFDQIILSIIFLYSYKMSSGLFFLYCFNKKIASYYFREGLPLLINGVAVIIYMKCDLILIKFFLDDNAVGIYSAASKVSEIFYFIPMILSTALFPSLIKAKSMGDINYETQIQELYKVFFLISIVISIATFLLAPYIIPFLFGASFDLSIEILLIQSWSAIFVFLGVVSSKWYIIQNLKIYLMIGIVIGATLNIVLNLVFIPKYGLIAAAWISLVTQIFTSYFINIFFKSTRHNFYLMTRSIFFFCNKNLYKKIIKF